MAITAPPLVRLIERRTFAPPRAVEVEHYGSWWPAWQSAWVLCNDGRGWRADVDWSETYEWGFGRHVSTVPPERVRLPGDGPASPC